MHDKGAAKKWKEVRPTTIQKMCAKEGMHPNNASTTCTGKKMLTRLFFFLEFVDDTWSQWSPLPHANGPRPQKEESQPPCQWSPFRERRILVHVISKGGYGTPFHPTCPEDCIAHAISWSIAQQHNVIVVGLCRQCANPMSSTTRSANVVSLVQR